MYNQKIITTGLEKTTVQCIYSATLAFSKATSGTP